MAQTQLYIKKAQVSVREESSQDTYLAPAAGEGMVLAEDVEITYDSSNVEQNAVRADGLTMDDVPGTMTCTIAYSVRIKGSGTAGTAPDFEEHLKACGMEATNVVSTSDTYTPLLTFDGAGGNPGPSYSCTVLEDGVRYALKGGFGNFVINATAGDAAFIRFTMTGAYVATADAALQSPTYQATTPPSFLGASVSINFGGAYTPKGVQSFTLDCGNQIVPVSDANDSAGIYGARIVNRRTFGSMECEMDLVANNDFFGDQRAGTSGTFTTGTVGSTAGNIWAVTCNRIILRPNELPARDGIRGVNFAFGVTALPTDVEGTNIDWQLQFT